MVRALVWRSQDRGGGWDGSLADQTVRDVSVRQGTFGASERLEGIVDWLDRADVHFNSLWFQKDPAGYGRGLCLSRSERDTLGRGRAPLLFSRTDSSTVGSQSESGELTGFCVP